MIKFILNKVPRKYLQKIANITIPLSAPFFYGKKITCPICNWSFRKILPYGYVTIRKNALCPRCLSLERHRMLWFYLKTNSLFFKESQKVLHVAPEYPFIKRFEKIISQNSGEYITADIESPLAKIKMNVENIPFEKNYFDVIICNHVLEHVSNDIKAISELYRVLKPNGYGVLLSPVDYDRESTYEDNSIVNPEERKIHFGQHDHLRVYGKDYAQRLSKAGFIVEQIDFKYHLENKAIKKMAFSAEILYIVKKTI